jgi:hypothetical protein
MKTYDLEGLVRLGICLSKSYKCSRHQPKQAKEVRPKKDLV